MSKISLSPSPTGSAVYTIASPAGSTDRTLNLPDAAGTLGLAGAAVARSQLPAGSVLQVVNAEYGIGVSTTSTTTVDTGLSASITPTSATSKILVLVSQTLTPPTAGSNTFSIVEVFRGGVIVVQDQRMNNNLQFNHNIWSCCKLDSPATTSTLTYKTKIATGSASFAVEAQHASLRTSFITLMEIAA